MREASKYASAAVADPDIRPIYVQMAEANNMNKDRPFDSLFRLFPGTLDQFTTEGRNL
ncbi:MAG TPA: hypothetical protein VMN99_14330 [Anaerolineales bacterium]|nr:hypothetical protein [Anaerolineales bacterium]